MRRARQIAAGLALVLGPGLPASTVAQDCPTCTATVTLTPSQADCFLSNLDAIRQRAEARSPALVNFSTCERAPDAPGAALAIGETSRGDADFLSPDFQAQGGDADMPMPDLGAPGCTEDCPEPARFAFLTPRQVECLADRVRAGGVSAPEAIIDLRACP